jgi:hypothetical protein
MVIGIIGLLLSLFFLSRNRTVVEDRPVTRREYY